MGKHSIIVIKDENNRYLQYFNRDWSSYLFLNFKMEEEDDSKICKYISLLLDVPLEGIHCEYLGDKVHSKYSVKDQKEKEYQHFFYKVDFSFPEFMKKETFVYQDKSYRWFSYDELLADERIQEVNADIVSFVKELEK